MAMIQLCELTGNSLSLGMICHYIHEKSAMAPTAASKPAKFSAPLHIDLAGAAAARARAHRAAHETDAVKCKLHLFVCQGCPCV